MKPELFLTILIASFSRLAEAESNSKDGIEDSVKSAALFERVDTENLADTIWLTAKDYRGRRCCIFDIARKSFSSLDPQSATFYRRNLRNVISAPEGLLVVTSEHGGDIYYDVVNRNGKTINKNLITAPPSINDGYIWSEPEAYDGDRYLLSRTGETLFLSSKFNYHTCTPHAAKEKVIVICKNNYVHSDSENDMASINESNAIMIDIKDKFVTDFKDVTKNKIYRWDTEGSLFLTYSTDKDRTY